MPRETLGNRRHEGRKPVESLAVEYEKQMLQLLRLPEYTDPISDEVKATEFPCHQNVFEESNKFKRELEPQLKEGEALRDSRSYLTGFAGKIAGVAIRVGTLLAIAEEASFTSVEHYRRGELFARYALSHAKLLEQGIGTDPVQELSKRLASWIERKSLATFTLREVYRFLGVETKEALPPLNLLVENGYIREVKSVEDQSKNGRPKSPAYEVNPEFLNQAN
jgi:hypothetical protein